MEAIDNAIFRATNFVFENRNEDGMWYNFLTRHHGESADWVSSFAGLNLLKAGGDKKELNKTAEAVLKRQRSNGGFSYNHKIVPDADSTAFAINFLTYFGYKTELEKARKFLIKHQNSDGGFGTYLEKNIRQYYKIPTGMSVIGWCASNPDITASILLVDPENKEALKYLLCNQEKDGRWRSYWWNSDVYATVHSLEALTIKGYPKKISQAQKWLTKDENVPEIPFYLALSIQSLLKNTKHNKIIEKRILKLLKTQRNDGSWNTFPVLRFPHPSNKKPWNNLKKWRPDARDQNRIFTTSTCIRVLSEYKRNL